MGLFLGLACVFALFAPPCLGAPLLQATQGDVTLHLGDKLQDDVVLATVSFLFIHN